MVFKKRLLLSVGISLGAVVILLGVLIFLGRDISQRVGKIYELQHGLNLKTRTADTLAILRQDFEIASPYAEELARVIPSRDQLVNFSRDLNLIASQNRVDLNVGFRGEAEKKDSLGRTDFTLTAQGSLDDLIQFLNRLKNSRYPVKFTSLDFTKQDKDKMKALLNGQVFSY